MTRLCVRMRAVMQDMFLLGAPSPLHRWLAFRFCELARRECEYVTYGYV